jgi:hypothetical protein
MAVTTAGNAVFQINSVTVGEVASATLSVSRQPIEVTAIGDTYRKHEYGIVEGTVNLELFWDTAGVAGHSTIITALENGTLLTAASVVWETGKSIAGDAYVQDVAITVAPNGVAQATCTLIFSGSAITITQ